MVRFSDFTGLPDIPDNTAAASPRGLAVRFILPDGTSCDMVCHSFNGFPVATSEEFRLFLWSIGASGPAASKPTALGHFLETHPVTEPFLTTQRPPASWATTPHFGVNSFRFTNAHGQDHHGRYRFEPSAGEHFLTPAELATRDPSFLLDEIKARVEAGTFSFRLFAQVAEAGDEIGDPSVAWPDNRRRVPLGRVTIERLAADTPEQDRATAFNPGNLPAGIEWPTTWSGCARPPTRFRCAKGSGPGGR